MSACSRRAGIIAVIGCLSPLVAGGGAMGQVICERCDAVLRLSPAEWDCVSTYMDRFLAARGDPVLVPFTLCTAVGPPPSRPRGTLLPSIEIKPEANGVQTFRRGARLSKSQLRCLKRFIESGTRLLPESFDAFSRASSGSE